MLGDCLIPIDFLKDVETDILPSLCSAMDCGVSACARIGRAGLEERPAPKSRGGVGFMSWVCIAEEEMLYGVRGRSFRGG